MATRQLAGARTSQPSTPGRGRRANAEEAAEGTVLRPGQLPADSPDEDYGDGGPGGDDADELEDDLDDDGEGDGEEQPPVPASLTFTTAPKQRRSDLVGPKQVAFMLDGVRLVAVRPAEASFVYLSLAGARSRPTPDKMADVVNFLDDCFDEASGAHLAARLRDTADDFDFEDMFSIMEKLLAKWTPRQGGPRPARQRGRRR
jgi:hypothetical protein